MADPSLSTSNHQRVLAAQTANNESNRARASVSEHYAYNRYGFVLTPDELAARQRLTDDAKRALLRLENERCIKWIDMFHDLERGREHVSRKFKDRVRKGIPDSFRVSVYQLLLRSKDRRDKQPTLYSTLLADPSYDHDPVQQDIEAAIIRDLHRTLPLHRDFAPGKPGQQLLFNVLRVYSRFDKPLGYCQGMVRCVLAVAFPCSRPLLLGVSIFGVPLPG